MIIDGRTIQTMWGWIAWQVDQPSRLYMDIDLTYLPLHERDLALDEMRNEGRAAYIGSTCTRRGEKMPAVRWKLLNILKMDPAKHQKAVRKLRGYLGV